MALPMYQRPAPLFEALFERSADDVIRSMDRAGDDIPEQTPRVKLSVNWAGLKRSRVPIPLQHPLQSDLTAAFSADVEVATSVPLHKRGIHMSRLNHLVAASVQTETPYVTLEEYARKLASEISRTQHHGAARVTVRGHLPYWEAVPGRRKEKDKVSLEELGLGVQALLENGAVSTVTELSVDHITACPCVQKTLAHARPSALDGGVPLLTHSQRCRSHLRITNLVGPLPLAEMLEAVDAAIFRTQNTLPREHELALVYRAHERPQFIEDAARELLSAAYKVLKHERPDCRIAVESWSMESIHGFDICAEAAATVGELAEVLR